MSENHYDKASRFAAKLDAEAFLGWLLGLPPDAFVFRDWLDTRAVPIPGDKDRTNDTVARLDNVAEHGLPWAVAVEFQSQPDPDMFDRLMGYLSGLRRTLRPDPERGSRFHVGAAVVNLIRRGEVRPGWSRGGREPHWSHTSAWSSATLGTNRESIC